MSEEAPPSTSLATFEIFKYLTISTSIVGESLRPSTISSYSFKHALTVSGFRVSTDSAINTVQTTTVELFCKSMMPQSRLAPRTAWISPRVRQMSVALMSLTMPWLSGCDGTPLRYSCLENPMDGGAWWAAAHGVTKSRTRLSNFTFTFSFSSDAALRGRNITSTFLSMKQRNSVSWEHCQLRGAPWMAAPSLPGYFFASRMKPWRNHSKNKTSVTQTFLLCCQNTGRQFLFLFFQAQELFAYRLGLIMLPAVLPHSPRVRWAFWALNPGVYLALLQM